MLRRLTKKVGRYRAGVAHDWPLATWRQIAGDAGFKSIDDFSKAEEVQSVMLMRNRGGARAAA